MDQLVKGHCPERTLAMSELRQIPRWQIGERAKVTLKEHEWEGKCLLEDLNLKGFKISSKEKLPADTVFEINLDLKSYLILDAIVKVCWKMEREGRYHYGMEFLRIKDQDKQDISQYLFKNHAEQVKNIWWSRDGIKE